MSENNDSSRSNTKSNSSRDARPSGNAGPPSPTESWRERIAESDDATGNESFTRHQWEELPSDPDVRADLGYEVTPWESIDTATDSDQVIYMPQNEELLKDDAFIVADEAALCDLGKQY